MIFLTDEDAIAFVKDNKKAPAWVLKARKYTEELCALIEGEKFAEYLITKIDKIESTAKAEVRKKFARNVSDLFERTFQPIQNVWASTGGVKDYQNGEYKMPDKVYKALVGALSDIRDGKSIAKYIEEHVCPVYHSDPSGIQWLTYYTDSNKNLRINPTYKSIGSIRTYTPRGQLVENLLLEPVDVNGNIAGTIDVEGGYTTASNGKLFWKLIDDLWVRTIIQEGETFTVSNDPTMTYLHLVGQCPIIINSNITDKYGNRMSPVHKVLQIASEFATDQSVKTIYKRFMGFPRSWRRGMVCESCAGEGKNGNDKCEECNGKGEIGRIDVADDIVLPLPKEGQPNVSGSDIMGFSSPDLDTWKQMTEELNFLENVIYRTHWGLQPMNEVQKTATEIYLNTQPQINKLNKYADMFEWFESIITEWVANIIDQVKPKDQDIALIVYGRRYILEGIDAIQKKYEDAKKNGATIGILDAIYQELITVKFKNDPAWLRIETIKMRVEPYLHWTASEINAIAGTKFALKKIFFQQWWSDLTESDMKDPSTDGLVDALEEKFDEAFEAWADLDLIAAPVVVPAAAPPIEEGATPAPAKGTEDK